MPRLFAVLACLAIAVPAAAQDTQKAKEYFTKGKSLFNEGDFAGAIVQYEKSYAIAKLPLLRFNIAQAHRLSGDREKALENYKKFVSAAPKSPYAAESRSWIEKFEKQMAVEEEKKRKAAAAEDKKRQEEAKERREAELRKIELENQGEKKLSTLGYAGIGSAGVGVAMVGVGVYFGLRAKSAESDINGEDMMWSDELLDKFDDGESDEKKMYIFTGIGAGLAVAGAALLVYDLMENKEPEGDTISVTPTLQGDLAGMALMGRF